DNPSRRHDITDPRANHWFAWVCAAACVDSCVDTDRRRDPIDATITGSVTDTVFWVGRFTTGGPGSCVCSIHRTSTIDTTSVVSRSIRTGLTSMLHAVIGSEWPVAAADGTTRTYVGGGANVSAAGRVVTSSIRMTC